MGWRLNFWDAATNKVLAFAGRHVFRDYLDVVHLHREHLPLAALAWAAGGKDPGLTPEFIVDWMRRTSRYTPQEIEKARLPEPPDLVAMKMTLHEATFAADELFAKLPPAEMGCLYLDRERPQLPRERWGTGGVRRVGRDLPAQHAERGEFFLRQRDAFQQSRRRRSRVTRADFRRAARAAHWRDERGDAHRQHLGSRERGDAEPRHHRPRDECGDHHCARDGQLHGARGARDE